MCPRVSRGRHSHSILYSLQNSANQSHYISGRFTMFAILSGRQLVSACRVLLPIMESADPPSLFPLSLRPVITIIIISRRAMFSRRTPCLASEPDSNSLFAWNETKKGKMVVASATSWQAYWGSSLRARAKRRRSGDQRVIPRSDRRIAPPMPGLESALRPARARV